MLDLAVTLWVCHRSVADLDAELFAPIFEFRPSELCAVVRDDPVGNAESDHNIMEEFLVLGGYDRGDGFGFEPLGEFIDGDEEVCVTTGCSLQGADHVEAPDYERPGDWDGLQFLPGTCICRAKYWYPSHLRMSSSAYVTVVGQKKPCL